MKLKQVKSGEQDGQGTGLPVLSSGGGRLHELIYLILDISAEVSWGSIMLEPCSSANRWSIIDQKFM